MYDEFGGTPEKILDQIYQLGEDALKPYEFLKKLHEIRLFFGDSLGANRRDGVKVSIEIDFLVNKREEANTDYLVSRIFKPNNDAKIEPINQDKTAIWYFGEQIEMYLRWATGDDQAQRPISDPNDPDIILSETGATIQCVGNWSVLRFLQKYKAEVVSPDQTSVNQVVLSFKIPLSDGKIAKIYVGVKASTPKKPGEPAASVVKIPTVPPGSMPAIPSSVAAVANEPVLSSRFTETNFEKPDIIQEVAEEENDEPERKAPVRKNSVRQDSARPRKRNPPKNSKKPRGQPDKPAKKKETESEKIDQIFEADDNQQGDEEKSLVEISAEPIE
jgi:hypothetical protein